MNLLIVVCIICGVLWKIVCVVTKGKCVSNKCLIGKIAIVTGGNSGIGFETALDLAKRGCKVIIADVADSENAVNEIIQETGNAKVLYKYIDLLPLASIRKFAEDILSSEEKLDILINNAGTVGFAGVFTKKDGVLKILQINYLGHFLLTHLLIEPLKMARGRVVFLSSCAVFGNWLNCTNFNVAVESTVMVLKLFIEYANSKLCVIIAAKLFSTKLQNVGISCYSVHPGLVSTPMLSLIYNRSKSVSENIFCLAAVIYLKLFGKTANEGAQTTLHCALSKDVENYSGRYFWDCTPFLEPPCAGDDEFCRKVWEISEDLVNLKTHEKI